MVTGAHSKKALYMTTPTKCRPQGYGTLFRHKEEIKRMERAEQKDPSLFQARIEANRSIKGPSMQTEARKNPREFSNKSNQKIWWRRERSYNRAWNQEHHSQQRPWKAL